MAGQVNCGIIDFKEIMLSKDLFSGGHSVRMHYSQLPPEVIVKSFTYGLVMLSPFLLLNRTHRQTLYETPLVEHEKDNDGDDAQKGSCSKQPPVDDVL